MMQGLEIIMDIESLEVYEVIDHDREENTEETVSENFIDSFEKDSQIVYQPSLFEAMCLLNTS